MDRQPGFSGLEKEWNTDTQHAHAVPRVLFLQCGHTWRVLRASVTAVLGLSV